MAIEEVWEEDTSERKVRPWAANGRGCRVGEVRSFPTFFSHFHFPPALFNFPGPSPGERIE